MDEMAEKNKYRRLVSRWMLTEAELEHFVQEARQRNTRLEDILLAHDVPKHEILLSLTAFYGYPFIEYDESVIVSPRITRRMNMEALKRELWLPLSIDDHAAEVIASRPDDPLLLDRIRAVLGDTAIDFRIALPSDLIRIIEHNQDVNPEFPPIAGRTPLAKVRTYLADRRSKLACHRTALARGRTGLAFLRTGLSFIAIALVLLRVFGGGYLLPFEALLMTAGAAGVIDGLMWYLPARALAKKAIVCTPTEPTGGTSMLIAADPGGETKFSRSAAVSGGSKLRLGWNRLSPVMRRRFLANDRTDLAEERTVLACYRTVMARARTGLSFTRTGIAIIGLGIALLRQFPAGAWTPADAGLIVFGSAMVLEGLYWYLPGRKAASEGARSVAKAEGRQSIWQEIFPFLMHARSFAATRIPLPPVKGWRSPGIWATTGLALERTLLADRRNVMARLRTVMARSRTGMAFIRTGISMFGVGAGLLVYFGTVSTAWTVFEATMAAAGLLFVADGLAWYLPAEKTRREFPYCFGEMEIPVPDYGIPAKDWRKAVFTHDDV